MKQLEIRTIDTITDYLTKKYQMPHEDADSGAAEKFQSTKQFKNMQWLIANYRSLMKLYGRENLPDEQLDTRNFHEIVTELMLDNASPWKFDAFVNELRNVAATTTEILNYVRHSMVRYKCYCKIAGDEKLQQQCRVIWQYYLLPCRESQKSLRAQIILHEKIEKSYFYILLNDGIYHMAQFILQ